MLLLENSVVTRFRSWYTNTNKSENGVTMRYTVLVLTFRTIATVPSAPLTSLQGRHTRFVGCHYQKRKSRFLLFLRTQQDIFRSQFLVRLLRTQSFSLGNGGCHIHFHWWCRLSVFLLLSFIRLGHEYQPALSSPTDGVRECTDWTSVYILTQKGCKEWSENLLDSREQSTQPDGPREGRTRDYTSRAQCTTT